MRALVQRVSQAALDVEGERLGAAKGAFGACMGVALVNDGPVTLMVEV
jgi:D-Tyr-tRNAtyr deacylase